MVNILKKPIDATNFTKCKLDLDINLTVGELLASGLVIEKQFTKAYI